MLPPGEAGIIAVKTPDPVVFLKYWNNPEATKVNFIIFLISFSFSLLYLYIDIS